MANGQSYQIGNLVQKMTSSDKDFRFMATNDLLSELQKDSIKLDEDAEKKVVKTLLNLLKDTNAEVQNLAVKCLGPLITKVKEAQADIIVDTLCANMLGKEEILKETSSIGLKTVILEIPIHANNLISAVCKKITGRMINAVSQGDVSLQLECLEIFSDLLFRFGHVMSLYYPQVKDALLPQLENSRTAINKRAITCIGFMTITCNDALYTEIINHILNRLKNSDVSNAKIYINCSAAICKHSGPRMDPYLKAFIDLIIKCIPSNDEDLKEACFLALEVYVRRCPKEASVYIEQIISLSLQYISYDPNYNYDDENDDEDMEMDNDADDDNNSDEDYSDDDDVSWKVRRSAAKVLETIIMTRLDMLEDFFRMISPVIVSQFKEREENVKVDIFAIYIALLRQTRAIISNSENGAKFLQILRNQVPDVVRSLDRQLKEKSVKTRQSCFQLLSELVSILPNALADPDQADSKKNFLNNIIPGIMYSLNNNNSTSSMKIEALAFLNTLLKTHKPQVFSNYFNALITEIKKAVTDPFYKITSEALLVLTQLVPIIRPSLEIKCDSNIMSYVESMYMMTLIKLKTSDIDQEVKERAITCMAQIISTFGDVMPNLQEVFALLLERLKNEVTRLTCVKGLIKIVSVKFPTPLNLSPLLPEAFSVLASFLRQNKRSLKFNTLLLIDTLCKNYNTYQNSEINEIILNEMVPLISENDLYISQLALTTLTSMILSHKAFLAIIPQSILPEALLLIRSPLLQGTTLTAMINFFCSIVQSSFPGLDCNELIDRLTQNILMPTGGGHSPPALSKPAFISISKCIAAISLLNEKSALATATNLIQQIRNPQLTTGSSDSVQLYSLLTVAEIGKKLNLESVHEPLQEAILESFYSVNEDIKSAASVCLGSVSVGNLERFLPFVMMNIAQKQKRQYLLLNALKEIISCSSTDKNLIQHLQPHLQSIWDLLIQHSASEEEGTRYVVAECLGKLALLNQSVLLPELLRSLNSQSSFVRETIITAIRFTISDYPHEADVLLKECMKEVLGTLQDPDINVRRVALVTFNSTAHNKPSLIRDTLHVTLPLLYKETQVKPELVREVEMGPFKHTVDDGLDLRKAAFECMYTLLESCLDRIEMFEFLNQVEAGLKDTYDIKMLTYLILIRLSEVCPSALLQRLDSIIAILKETCTSKLKANAVKQEHEKQDELRRSAIRAFVCIFKIPEAEKNAYVADMMNMIKSSTDLKPLFESVQNSNKINNDAFSPMEVEFIN